MNKNRYDVLSGMNFLLGKSASHYHLQNNLLSCKHIRGDKIKKIIS